MINDRFEDEHEVDEGEEAPWEAAGAAGRYQRILAVVAGVDDRWRVPGHAIQLAAWHDAALHLLSMPAVPMVAAMPDMLLNADKLLNEVARQTECRLERLVHAAARAGVPCHRHLRWGYSAATILQVADDIRCDLIIMRAPPLTPWRRIIQPNAVRRVLSRARQPVLLLNASVPVSESRYLERRE